MILVLSPFTILLLVKFSNVLAVSKNQLNGNLLVGNDDEIFLFKKNGELIATIASMGANSLDYDCKKNEIVFVNTYNKKVYVQSSSAPEELISMPNWNPRNAAIDTSTNKIYVSDNSTFKIYAYVVREQIPAPVYQGHRKLSITENWHVAIDPKKNYIFIQANSVIIRARPDGTEPKEIYNGRSSEIGRITVRISDSRLYWMDVDNGIVKSVNYEGKDEKSHYKRKSNYEAYSRFDSYSIAKGMMYGFCLYCNELFVLDLNKGTRKVLKSENLNARAILAVNC